mmetsp:Transcript_51368/g.128903  ORF Transcript_51368/g.128903 Transcript_51368/m.128903 type:complete len:341 (+) Transcript_51368:313-1335(+)
MLGKGDVGRVYLVELKGTDQLFAMKCLDKKEMVRRKKERRVLTEQQILRTSQHPFIVTLHYSFQTHRHLFFVMDYCAGGEFFYFLKTQPDRRISEDAARFYAAETLSALEYLHMNGFLYRDLKPENLLLHESGHIMLTDFDLANTSANPVEVKIAPGSGKKKSAMLHIHPTFETNSFVGTDEYLAPEVLTGFKHTHALDWWTFGIFIYEMIFSTTPFKGHDKANTFQQILSCKVTFPQEPVVSPECKSLIKKLLVLDPQKRLGCLHGASEIKAHPWFKSINWPLLRNSTPPMKIELKNPRDTSHFRRYDDDDSVVPLNDDEVTSTELAGDDPFKRFKRVG